LFWRGSDSGVFSRDTVTNLWQVLYYRQKLLILLLLGCTHVFHAPLAEIGFNCRSFVIKHSCFLGNTGVADNAYIAALNAKEGLFVVWVLPPPVPSEGDCKPKYLQIQSTFNARKRLKDRLLILVLHCLPFGALVTIECHF
jgi:hypothetical protein